MREIHPIRVYADTSVFGGLFDIEFHAASQRFFEQVESGRFQLVISSLLEEELLEAPSRVYEVFMRFAQISELAIPTLQDQQLQRGYIDAGVVTEKSLADAGHVALASVAGCSIIVSWNFKHIVHFQKIPMYNAINKLHGYAEIAIHSPQEVIEDGES